MISGDVGEVADACDANPACFSFDMEGSYGRYLKGAGQQQYTEGFNNFCKLAAGNACAGTYTFKRRSSIPGNDIDCRYTDYNGKLQPFCRVNGDVKDLAASCDANADCAAFDMDGSSTGYLKKADGPTQYTEGYSTYVKRAGGKSSAGSG
uniref:Apple domain-containing protein n=1 Tax=Tetradesmus obliquus TaxID=3088 RepID=A0A383VUA6_TETOB|eukprot:jgi/Sobl393_1/5153/SZX67986.1